MSEVPEGIVISETEPIDARPSASLMLTRDGENGLEVLLAHRVDELPAFPGYWAFPGGGIGKVDREAVEKISALSEFEDSIEAASHAGMHRELIEEMGFTIPSAGTIERADAETRKAILEDKSAWMKAVVDAKLPFCADALIELTRRTTPEFAPIRFENRFMFMHCKGEVPEPALDGQTEFDAFRWVAPEEVLEEWKTHQIKIPPPIVTILMEVVELLPTFDGDIDALSADISSRAPAERTILFAHGVECIPIPTATLPPATTTNSYLLGIPGGEHILVDPAIRNEEGMKRITAAIQRMEEKGGKLIAYLFTHRHLDHLGDLTLLEEISDAEIWASAETAAVLAGRVRRIIMDADLIVLSGGEGAVMWRALITPGHCPGHVCLINDAGLVAGDMIAGMGTILIPPVEGRMEEYLHQLQRLKTLEPHLLFPSHGPVLPLPQTTLNNYIEHREKRHDIVLQAVESGLEELADIAIHAYEDTPAAHPILARQQTLSHLLAWQRVGKITAEDELWRMA